MFEKRPIDCRRAPRQAGLGLLLMLMPLAVAAADDALRDPFQPPGWNEPTAAADTFDADAWTLESTLTSNGRQVAIINGESVRVGDRVGGARVEAIERGRVRLDYEGRVFTLERTTVRVRAE